MQLAISEFHLNREKNDIVDDDYDDDQPKQSEQGLETASNCLNNNNGKKEVREVTDREWLCNRCYEVVS